jgi:hypothetical protein
MYMFYLLTPSLCSFPFISPLSLALRLCLSYMK